MERPSQGATRLAALAVVREALLALALPLLGLDVI